jgi:hypothetical protein
MCIIQATNRAHLRLNLTITERTFLMFNCYYITTYNFFVLYLFRNFSVFVNAIHVVLLLRLNAEWNIEYMYMYILLIRLCCVVISKTEFIQRRKRFSKIISDESRDSEKITTRPKLIFLQRLICAFSNSFIY